MTECAVACGNRDGGTGRARPRIKTGNHSLCNTTPTITLPLVINPFCSARRNLEPGKRNTGDLRATKLIPEAACTSQPPGWARPTTGWLTALAFERQPYLHVFSPRSKRPGKTASWQKVRHPACWMIDFGPTIGVFCRDSGWRVRSWSIFSQQLAVFFDFIQESGGLGCFHAKMDVFRDLNPGSRGSGRLQCKNWCFRCFGSKFKDLVDFHAKIGIFRDLAVIRQIWSIFAE